MRIQSLRCHLASFVFSLMCVQARWPPERMSKISHNRVRFNTDLTVQFINLHPSLKKVCFYVDSSTGEDIQSVGPVAYKENMTFKVPRATGSTFYDEGVDDVLFFEYGYKEVSASKKWCEPLSGLTDLSPNACDEPSCQTKVFHWGRHDHLASDYIPQIKLKVNGRLAETPHEFFPGANLAITNECPLYCLADIQTITHRHQDLGAPQPTGSSHWEVPLPQCSHGVIDIKCSSNPDGRERDGHRNMFPGMFPDMFHTDPNWGSTPDAHADFFFTKVDVTDLMHSICDTGAVASYVEVIIIGLGSEDFPFETRVSSQAPSQFTCKRPCNPIQQSDSGDWWSEDPWGETRLQKVWTVGVAAFILILCLVVSVAVWRLVLKREGTIPAENMERFTSQDRRSVRGIFGSYIDGTSSISASSIAQSSHSLRSTPSMELTSKFKW